ncbi:MAG: hypothetical protein ACLPVY_01020 [Acidimicrobiia bacterium]
MRGFVASCSAVILAGVALAGCGGGGTKAASSSPSTTNGGISSPSNAGLSQLVANANKQIFKITYVDGGGNVQTYEQDGNGDSVSGSAGSLTFDTKTSETVCDQTSGSYQCTRSPGSPDAATNPFSGVLTALQSQLSALGGRFGHTSTTTIAGRAAQCVTFSEQDLLGSVGGTVASSVATQLKTSYSYCIDDDTGVTLQVAVTDPSGKRTTSLLVTKFESPKPSDFIPPATPATPPNVASPDGGSITNSTIPGGG